MYKQAQRFVKFEFQKGLILNSGRTWVKHPQYTCILLQHSDVQPIIRKSILTETLRKVRNLGF